MLPSSGGGQDVTTDTVRTPDPTAVAVPDGYQIEVVTTGLTFPTGIAFDEAGTPYVTEAGYAYGEVFLEPRLLRITPDGTTEVVVTGQKNGPWNGVTYADGFFYVAEGGQLLGGKILKIGPDGGTTALVENLPSLGDHHTNGPVIQDGYVYFGQGTATNAGVVGLDNYKFGWLERFPDFHDIPCKDIQLRAVNFATENPLTEAARDEELTGPFLPYGTPAEAGQTIPGALPCSGAVMRVPTGGGDLELVAWGFRNPFGLALNRDGALYVTDNSYDARGSRPLWGTGDYLWRVETDTWYGWPDYAGGLPTTLMKPPGQDRPEMLLQEHPNDPPEPVAKFGVHSSSNGFDFSHAAAFGYVGEAFVAQFGDMAPGVGKVLDPVGYRVVKVDPATGVIDNFVANKAGNGPASKLGTGGLERPNAVRFSPDGSALYIVDFGVMLTEPSPKPIPGTGVVWKVTKR